MTKISVLCSSRGRYVILQKSCSICVVGHGDWIYEMSNLFRMTREGDLNANRLANLGGLGYFLVNI